MIPAFNEFGHYRYKFDACQIIQNFCIRFSNEHVRLRQEIELVLQKCAVPQSSQDLRI